MTSVRSHMSEKSPHSQDDAKHATQRLDRLRAVVMLAGAVRTTRFHRVIGRSMLNLPVDEQATVLDHWQQQVGELAQALGRSSLSVRLLLSSAAQEPTLPQHHRHAEIAIERDPAEYRGSGGVVRDVCAAYDDEDYVLVTSAAQVLTEPLSSLAHALAALQSEVAIVAHPDGTPSGLMLMRCGVLRQIPPTGFVDMKEQALPMIASRHRVMVISRDPPSGMPVRVLDDYIRALRVHHRNTLNGSTRRTLSDAEHWKAKFGLIEPGATVSEHVRIHDSVVLRGGSVGTGAILVRSVVGPGAVVRGGSMIADQIIGHVGRTR